MGLLSVFKLPQGPWPEWCVVCAIVPETIPARRQCNTGGRDRNHRHGFVPSAACLKGKTFCKERAEGPMEAGSSTASFTAATVIGPLDNVYQKKHYCDRPAEHSINARASDFNGYPVHWSRTQKHLWRTWSTSCHCQPIFSSPLIRLLICTTPIYTSFGHLIKFDFLTGQFRSVLPQNSCVYSSYEDLH